jgi:hypothetical protein
MSPAVPAAQNRDLLTAPQAQRSAEEGNANKNEVPGESPSPNSPLVRASWESAAPWESAPP